MIELARISGEKEVEGERRDVADVARERIAVDRTVAEQEESIKQLRMVQEAERERQALIITAEAQAQEHATSASPRPPSRPPSTRPAGR